MIKSSSWECVKDFFSGDFQQKFNFIQSLDKQPNRQFPGLIQYLSLKKKKESDRRCPLGILVCDLYHRCKYPTDTVLHAIESTHLNVNYII